MTTPEDFEQDPVQETGERSTLERLFPELLRRVIETGTRNLTPEAVKQVLGDLKLPREALHYTFSQLDETKNGVYRVIAKELHELFERTNLAEEFAKALSLLSLEVKMEVRFKPATLETKTRVTRSRDAATPGKEANTNSESENS